MNEKEKDLPRSAVEYFLDLKRVHGISTAELARRIDVCIDNLSMILVGNVRLTPDIATRLCLFFSLDIEIILMMEARYEAWMMKSKRMRNVHANVSSLEQFLFDKKTRDLDIPVPNQPVKWW